MRKQTKFVLFPLLPWLSTWHEWLIVWKEVEVGEEELAGMHPRPRPLDCSHAVLRMPHLRKLLGQQ